jgi:hypothetical protein
MHRILAIGAVVVLALALAGAASAWSWPADGVVLRPFALGADVYAGGQHRGSDVAGPDGSAVKAPAAGLVTFAGSLPTYGRGVTIMTADGYTVTLVHLGTIEVGKGATVGEGDTVGTMGASGTPEQDEPSVHLGIRRASEEEGYVDPLGLLPPRAAPAPAPAPTPETVVAPAQAAAPVAVDPPSPPTPSPVDSPAPTAPPTAVTATASAQSATATPSTSSAAPTGASPDSAAPPSTTPAQQGADEAGITIAESTSPAVGTETADTPGPGSVARPGAFRLDAPVRPVAASTHGTSGATSTADVSAVGADAAATSGAHVVHGTAARAEKDHPGTHPASRVSSASADARKATAETAETAETVPLERSVPTRPAARAIVRDLPVPVSNAVRGVPTPQRAAEAQHDAPSAVAGLGLRALAAGIVLLALLGLLAATVGRRVARRIGMDGAVLRHHADLLRQLDAAHRPRLHDRGRGRLRSSSATART